MLRRLLAMAVLLGFIQPLQPYQIPDSSSSSQYSLYLPLVVNLYPPPVDVVELGDVDWTGYPGYMCTYGYVTSIPSTAVYSITLAIDVKVHPYCIEPEVCPPYSSTYYTEPELEATLPDQVNPYSFCLQYTKTYYSFGEVELAHASLTPPDNRVIYPLTITSVLKEGTEWETTVSGSVRNDSGHRLKEVRVVGIAG
jgi:hypothetical protein